MKSVHIIILFYALLAMGCSSSHQTTELHFTVSYDQVLSEKPLDGRVLVFITKNKETEPRFQVSSYPAKSAQVFGVNVDNWKGEEMVKLDAQALGFPQQSLSTLPKGEYYVQAMLHKYETFNRADGHTVKLPMNRGAGQNYRKAPGNLFSKPVKVYLDPSSTEGITLKITEENPPIEPPKDSKYIKHIKMRSDKLSQFWGRDIFLGAHVLLPEGFDEHPNARYPLVIFHGHFPYDFGGFRTTPPDPNLKPTYSARFRMEGYNLVEQQEAYEFYKQWTSKDFPRMIIIKIQHANPYYDDSYAVNSENLGPYGDAITHELIPYIEEKFRGLGEGWARFLYGGSTGGWEAMAAQVFYPDEYNGAFIACPDPIDFRAYTTVNLYEDENAYFQQGDFGEIARPGHRDYRGHVHATVKNMNDMEEVIGTNSRSGDQYAIWEAVYSPVGPDGYPQPIWDKKTGKIDKKVANYWRENYDLRYILQRDWQEIGDKLKGKLHIYVGDMDNYYLNNAVVLTEEFLETTKNPYYAGEVKYGDGDEHCWNGFNNLSNAVSRLRYNTLYIPNILDRIKKSAPKGSDLTSWRY